MCRLVDMQHPPPPPLPPGPAPPADAGRPKDGIPYIGSRISLISKTDIRYEGFLFNIDTRQSMVALQNVRSFGTEGRRPEHIPPSPHVLQYATFKASEIKDLHVCEAAPPPMPPMPPQPGAYPGVYAAPPHMPSGPPPPPSAPPLPPTPAPPAAAVAPPKPPSVPPMQPQQAPPSPIKAAKPAAPVLLTPGSVSSAHAQHMPSPRPQTQVQPQSAPTAPSVAEESERSGNGGRRQQQQQQQQTGQGNRTIPGMGGHLLKRKERRVPGDSQEAPESAAVADFNFEQRLNDFNKEAEFSKIEVQETKVRPRCFVSSSQQCG